MSIGFNFVCSEGICSSKVLGEESAHECVFPSMSSSLHWVSFLLWGSECTMTIMTVTFDCRGRSPSEVLWNKSREHGPGNRDAGFVNLSDPQSASGRRGHFLGDVSHSR